MSFDIAKPSFKLDESFFKIFEKREPKWGPIGRTVFYRTYVRRDPETDKIETVPQVFRRVVEGCFSILKNHCQEHKREWSEAKTQRAAQKMFEIFWEFMGLPSGRALWTMGTLCIEKAGGSALQNCAFASSKRDIVEQMMFMMDQSMLGVGVGFDVFGEGQYVEGVRGLGAPYVIDDSREGWVDSLAVLSSRLISSDNPYHILIMMKYGQPVNQSKGLGERPADRTH